MIKEISIKRKESILEGF